MRKISKLRRSIEDKKFRAKKMQGVERDVRNKQIFMGLWGLEQKMNHQIISKRRQNHLYNHIKQDIQISSISLRNRASSIAIPPKLHSQDHLTNLTTNNIKPKIQTACPPSPLGHQ
jgi:hypothetical protein